MFEQLIAKNFTPLQEPPMVVTLNGTDGSDSSQTKAVPPSLPVETINTNSGHAMKTYRHWRFDCPRFDGGDFVGWLMKCEQYFEAGSMEDEAKVRTVMLQLEGRALQWHQHYAGLMGVLHRYNGSHIWRL